MINKKYLAILFKNKTTRDLFEIKKSFFGNKYSYNKLLESSDLRFMSSKAEVLYVIFPSYIEKDNYRYHLCKVVVDENIFSFCGLHVSSTCEESNKEYANQSYLVNYKQNHDRNMMVQVGACTYI